MKNIFLTIMLLLATAFLNAEENDKTKELPYIRYSALSFDLTRQSKDPLENSFFSFCCEGDSEEHEELKENPNALMPSFNTGLDNCITEACRFIPTSVAHWHHYKAEFGMEKIVVRFPHPPSISHGLNLIVAHAYDHEVLYSFSGYYPPIGGIEPISFFDNALMNVSHHPFKLLNYAIYQYDCFWILDYLAHDLHEDMVIKNRTIVTPFNAYTLQAVCPFGFSTRFDYFIDSLKIKLK